VFRCDCVSCPSEAVQAKHVAVNVKIILFPSTQVRISSKLKSSSADYNL
jgi:hypothetical protein